MLPYSVSQTTYLAQDSSSKHEHCLVHIVPSLHMPKHPMYTRLLMQVERVSNDKRTVYKGCYCGT